MNKIMVTLLLIMAKIYGVYYFKFRQHKNFVSIYKNNSILLRIYTLILVATLNVHLVQYAYYALKANHGTTTKISYAINFSMLFISMNISYYNKLWKYGRQYDVVRDFITILNYFNLKFLIAETKLFHDTKIVDKLNKILFVNIFGVGLLLAYLMCSSCLQYGTCVNVGLTFVRIYLEFIVFYDFIIIIIGLTIQINFLNKQLRSKIEAINTVGANDPWRPNKFEDLDIYLGDLILIFNRIKKLISKINNLYSNQFSILVISKVFKIPNRIYFAYLYMALYIRPDFELYSDDGIKYHLLNGGSNVLYNAMHMHMIILLLELFHRQMDKTRFLLGELREIHIDKYLENTINIFRIQLELADCNIVPYKLLIINKELIHSMVAYAVNVLILLIQFQSSGSCSNC